MTHPGPAAVLLSQQQTQPLADTVTHLMNLNMVMHLLGAGVGEGVAGFGVGAGDACASRQ